ncbi:MAG TPA: serine/threonine-protein kinase [Caldimonas sp.]
MSPVHEAAAVRARAATPGHALPIGSRLREYEIKGLIGEGTCSIVYLGWDHALQRKVAIKEYMPAAMAGRLQGSTNVVVASDRHLDAVKAGMRSFLNEARVLARFDHPSLVKIYRFWEENGTAYMVMPYYEGPTLKATLAELGHVPSETELRTWLKPILNAVTLLHEGGVWHQNIGPDEIVLTPFGPVLLGFAGASHAIEAMRHTPAAALKPGYAAIEQYGSEAGTTRGPWTDLYALAAIVHAAITGNDPPPAADRLTEDRMRPLSIVAAGLYSERFLAAIDAAMAVQPRRRPPDHDEFRALMGDIEAPEAVSLAPAPDLMQEPFTGSPAREREATVPDPPPTATPSNAPAPPPPAVAEVTPQAVVKVTPARALDGGERAPPSWMQSAHARGLGKRALYGVIAGTCALIGIAALVLQFATRPAPGNAATPAASTAHSAAPAPTATTMTAAAIAPPPARATAAPRAATATTPAPSTAPAPRAAVAGTAPAITPAATPAGRGPAQTARTSALIATPSIVATTPLERQARCTEILQKASLEKITPAETDFFKRECK